jgi:uncharacterized metal-binding protein YceD (DUF177 family)
MKKLDRFEIQFSGLSAGTHDFEFELDRSFFDEHGDEETLGADVKVDVKLLKDESMMTFLFSINGTITRSCHRCLENVNVPIKVRSQMIVRFENSTYDDDEIDDLVLIGRKEHSLNLAQHIYDFIAISVPMRVVHEKGECDGSVTGLIGKKKENEAGKMDPRWAKLKDISEQ